MSWNIVCRVGDSDDYLPSIAPTDPRLILAFEAEGSPNAIRCNFDERFDAHLGGLPNGPARDLVRLASAVLTADLCFRREYGEERWTRDITIHLPVSDTALWAGASRAATDTLSFLTGDIWRFEFRPIGEVRATVPARPVGAPPDVVSLFSGGLDSLIGVVDLLAAGKRTALVGHYGAGMTHTYQERVAATLEREYPGLTLPVLFHAQPPTIDGAEEREQTMRSRSFLFFALGIAVAHRLGAGVPLAVPENGLISLNVPLTAARSGSYSTRTTHPHYVELYRKLLAELGIANPVVLPYRLKTKGEMLKECGGQVTLGKAAPLTMSCAHSEGSRWEGSSPGTHCGYCFPCLIRRAATMAAGTPDAGYTVDVRTAPPEPTTQKGRDFRALSIAIERFRTRSTGRTLFDVLDTGPIPPEDIRAYAEVYRRGMLELTDLLT
ncbi:hypothetical protein J0H58_23995 [bacterium]|nr:hypothetical protein [bacterium]